MSLTLLYIFKTTFENFKQVCSDLWIDSAFLVGLESIKRFTEKNLPFTPTLGIPVPTLHPPPGPPPPTPLTGNLYVCLLVYS